MIHYDTLGDIADALGQMKADGMTLESIRYTLSQVYADEMAAERQARSDAKEVLLGANYGMGAVRLAADRGTQTHNLIEAAILRDHFQLALPAADLIPYRGTPDDYPIRKDRLQ